MSLLHQPLTIKNLTLRNRVFLAPMSGVSDLPFRQRAWRAGAGMVVCEMVASGELCKGAAESFVRIQSDTNAPHIIQLAGREAQWMAKACIIAQNHHADMIDINMGCPAKKVIGGYSGAALMRDEKLAMSLIEAVLKVAKVPVSLKMRLGWDDKNINAPQLAKLAAEAGIAMITIHGRTRMQFYNGKAHWDKVKAVRDVISIPLVVNGDISNKQDALNALNNSGADAVMVGRASYGSPWLCGEIAGHVFKDNLADYISQHYISMLLHYGEDIGLRHARKHLNWYVTKHAASFVNDTSRHLLLTSTNKQQILELLHEIFTDKTINIKVA